MTPPPLDAGLRNDRDLEKQVDLNGARLQGKGGFTDTDLIIRSLDRIAAAINNLADVGRR